VAESGRDVQVLETFTIITTEANADLQSLHKQMPVILEPKDYNIWLDPTLTESRVLEPLLKPSVPGTVGFYPVSRFVNSPANDDVKV